MLILLLRKKGVKILRNARKEAGMKDIIILAAVLSAALYYIIAEVTYQLKNRLFRRRLIIGVLIAALLLSQTSIVNVFTRTGAETASAAEKEKIITAFAELPDDIKEQTVPVGTTLEELLLPDTLEAVCAAADTDTQVIQVAQRAQEIQMVREIRTRQNGLRAAETAKSPAAQAAPQTEI